MKNDQKLLKFAYILQNITELLQFDELFSKWKIEFVKKSQKCHEFLKNRERLFILYEVK